VEEDIYGGVGGDGEGVYDTAGGRTRWSLRQHSRSEETNW
jgi:hypothetical protein